MTSNATRIRELNDSIRYTMWSVFQAQGPLDPAARDETAAEAAAFFADLAAKDVVVRGT
jgi:peroxiredoxin